MVAEYQAGKSAHVIGRRHDLSRNLIRIDVEKAGAGVRDQDQEAADGLGAYEDAHLRAGQVPARRPAGAGDRVFKRGSERRTTAERRAHVRDDRPAGIPARRGCALMGLPRSTYYAAPKGPPPDEALVAEMQAITDEFECYGYRRVGAELRHRGTVVNAKKVRRLMRENDLNPRARRRFSRTTDSDHDGPIFPFIAKDYAVHGPNQLWVGDITYVGSRPASSISRSSSTPGRGA